MVGLLKKHWTAFVSIILSVSVICYYTIIKMDKKTDIAKIRTVQVSDSTQACLKDFENYDIIEKENSAEFSGVVPFDEKFVSVFDNVALSDIANSDNYKTVVNNSFDMEKMQFSFNINLVDADGNVVDEDSMVTDAFITENGGLDAFIEMEGKSYLLSEYQAMLQDSVDDCGLFALLIASVAIAIVSYVVVAETAEQIRAKSNYKYNMELEARGNGVNKGNYITNQRESIKNGYKSANYRFGFTTFDNVGCEVAAIYNLLIALGKSERLSESINNVEKWAIEYSIGWGSLGSSPSALFRYLNKKGIRYLKYNTYKSFKTAIDKKSSCKVIMASWNNGGALKSLFSGAGLHTYFINKVNYNSLVSYNFIGSQNFLPYNSIDELYNYTGDFIIGYII